MKYVVDLDGTLCETDGEDYEHARPMWDRIEALNALHRAGHHVVVWTARGNGSNEDYRALTEKQLDEWNVRRDGLIVGDKEWADVYVDDRMKAPEEVLG